MAIVYNRPLSYWREGLFRRDLYNLLSSMPSIFFSTQFLVNILNEKIKQKSKQIPQNLEIGLVNSTTVPLDFYSLETTRLLGVKRLICITSHCAFCFIRLEDSPLGFIMDSWQWKI